jgi:ADP-ribose pyrophosphatase YjhB (NUDIX family)
MGYIHELRQRVGHMPIIMVGGSVLVINQNDELLMMRRTDNGCWGIPGGALESGERVEDAARRETQEECGMEVGEMALFGVFSGPELYYRYPNGDEVYNVCVVYLTHDVNGAINIDPGEHSEMGYFGIQSLPEPISPPIKPILEELQRRFFIPK